MRGSMPTLIPSPAVRRGGDNLALLAILAGITLFSGCDRHAQPSDTALARLDARAVLPADTFAGDGPVGEALDNVTNERRPPFAQIPVQGFSSLLPLDDGEVLVLQDNGFGALDNSADYPLRWYRLRVDFAQGAVTVLDHVTMSDPDRLLPFPLARPDSARGLSGADLDPESFVRVADGTFWVGDDFGPSLVHFDADGHMLDKPMSVPVPPALRAFARGTPYLRTPDHPDLRFLKREETRQELANLPRSGGLEGLAHQPDNPLLYAAVEKGLVDDPVGVRRLILEFDPARHGFTGNWWPYRVSREDVSLAAFEAADRHAFLVTERCPAEGKKAEIKQIYRVELGIADDEGYLVKTLVCDLLDLDDFRGLTQPERGAVGLGRRFSFPFVTPECLAVIDDSTLIVANDNNYPFSAGRRRGRPDDNEFIRLRLNRPLGAPGPGGE